MDKQVLFRLRTQIFALPISSIERIIDTENMTLVPDVDPYIMGIKEYNDAVLPVVNLSKRFFDKDLEDVNEAQVIVVEWKESKVGLAVDEVTSIATYSQEEMTRTTAPEETQSDRQKVRSVSAFVQTDKGIVSLIDSDKLFNEKGSEDILRLLEIQSIHAQSEK